MKKILLLIGVLLTQLTLNAQDFKFSAYLDQEISCYGNNDGYIQAECLPATHEYMYWISKGTTFKDSNLSGTFQGLKPGTYKICGGYGTTKKCTTVTVTTPKKLAIKFGVDKSPTKADPYGTLTLEITGGTTDLQPYLVTWTNSKGDVLNSDDTPYNVSMVNLKPDTYTVKIEDDHGCFLTKSYKLVMKK
jgi:hypothetical protein